jgi:hypothetical protein
MAGWIVNCLHCNTEVTYSKDFLNDNDLPIRTAVAFISKPDVPDRGLKLTWPKCNKTFIYLRHH